MRETAASCDAIVAEQGHARAVGIVTSRRSKMPKAPPDKGQFSRRDDHDQGIIRDERGEEQPMDKERAQRVSRQDKGGDPPGE